MKKFIKSVLAFIRDSVKMLIFFLRSIRCGIKKPIKRTESGTAVLLANGPSLKEVLKRVKTDKEFENVDYFVLNYFALDDIFWEIKPKHYCLADPMFFRDTHNKERAKNLFYILQKVDWDMSIYIPSEYRKKKFLKFSGLSNPMLNVVEVNSILYSGYPSLKNYFYKKGLSLPRIQTVAILAIYVALNKGFSLVRLYGVDHTFTKDLCVDEKNRLCSIVTHFYDNTTSLVPLIREDNSEHYKISDYLQNITNMFKGHDELADYAEYIGAKILNCTEGSFIDCYDRP